MTYAPALASVEAQGEPSAAFDATALLESMGLHVKECDAPDVFCVLMTGNEGYGASRPVQPLPRKKVLDTVQAMAERGGGYAVLITDASAHTHGTAEPDLAAQRDADRSWWRHLAARYARHGVIANEIQLGYAPFLGHQLPEDVESELMRHLLIRRPARADDLATALRLFTSSAAAYIVGETLPLDGGLDAMLIAPARDASKRPARPHHAAAAAEPWRDPFDLTGRVVLVAGASSGIGAAAARDLAARGADVVLAARRVAALDAIAADVTAAGRRAWTLRADLTRGDQIPGVVAQAFDVSGGIDGLVYAAGVLDFDRVGDNTALREQILGTNLVGYAALCDEIVARWVPAGTRGSIVAVGSVSAHCMPVPHAQTYAASKAGMVQYTRMLATSVAKHGIRANAVKPGIVITEMTEATTPPSFQDRWITRIPAGRVGQARDIAGPISYLIGGAGYLTGAAVRVDGGFSLGALPALAAGGSAGGGA